MPGIDDEIVLTLNTMLKRNIPKGTVFQGFPLANGSPLKTPTGGRQSQFGFGCEIFETRKARHIHKLILQRDQGQSKP